MTTMVLSTDSLPRVLHVAQPGDGGVARCVVQYLAAARSCGWQVAVACPGGQLARDAEAIGVPVLPWRARRSPGPSSLGEAVRLQRIIESWRPDLVHLHSAKAGLAGRLAVRGRVPTIFQPHAWSFDAVAGLQGSAARWWERSAVPWTTRLVCVSRAERDRGVAAGVRAAYAVATNGVELAAFPPAGDVERARARRMLDLGDEPIAVCLGRLCVQKGQDILLDAWPAVLSAVPSATLLLVGDGPAAAALAARRAPGVRLVGATESPWIWLAAADVVVVPSRWDGHAFVLLEAMAAARSVVAADVTGVAETLGDVAGARVPPVDPDSLATALARRLLDRDLADHEGRTGRDRVERLFDATTTVARVLDLCTQLLAGSGPALRPRVPATSDQPDP